MKKIKLITCLILCFSFVYFGCKEEKPVQKDVTLAKKYAKYRIGVYQNDDLSQWAATLSKAEPVDLLAETEKIIKKKQYSISKIKLSDDTIAYVNSETLADKPIVFIKDSKVYVRNNAQSAVKTTIPAGTIAFIVGEKGDWAQVYAGKINGVWVTKQWVNDGYSAESNLIIDAKNYEVAMETMNKNPSEVKEEEMKKAISLLEEMKDHQNIFAELASAHLNADKNKAEEEKTEVKEESVPTESQREEPAAE